MLDAGGEEVCATFSAGFPATDFPECGPTVWAFSADPEAAWRAVDALFEEIVAQEAEWRVTTSTPARALDRVAELMPVPSGRPVMIADTQDNPGQGGDARTTGLLRALVSRGFDGAVAPLWAPSAASSAHRAGTGARIALTVGGHPGIPGAEPFSGLFEVEHLGDGRYTIEGPMMRGTSGNAGPTACLRIGGVRVVVTTHKVQLIDRAQLRAFGVDSSAVPVIVAKSSVHFRADFAPTATEVIVAAAPGPIPADPAELPWQHLPAGIRRTPRPSGAPS